MWGDIGAAAIYGAIGGGVGALIGTMLGSLFKKTNFSQLATTVLTVAFVVIGINFSEPLLKPHIGKYLPSSAATDFDSQFETIIEGFEKYPLASAILERDPTVREQLRHELLEIVENAASPAIAKQLAFSAAYNLTLTKFTYYVARATDEDLMLFVKFNVNLLDDLAERDPRFCFDYLYNPNALVNVPEDYVETKIGPERFSQQQIEGAALVRNAYDDIPEYDIVAAQAIVDQAATILQEELGPEKLGLLTGALQPESDEDAKLACDATAGMYRFLLSQDAPELGTRHIFAAA